MWLHWLWMWSSFPRKLSGKKMLKSVVLTNPVIAIVQEGDFFEGCTSLKKSISVIWKTLENLQPLQMMPVVFCQQVADMCVQQLPRELKLIGSSVLSSKRSVVLTLSKQLNCSPSLVATHSVGDHSSLSWIVHLLECIMLRAVVLPQGTQVIANLPFLPTNHWKLQKHLKVLPSFKIFLLFFSQLQITERGSQWRCSGISEMWIGWIASKIGRVFHQCHWTKSTNHILQHLQTLCQQNHLRCPHTKTCVWPCSNWCFKPHNIIAQHRSGWFADFSLVAWSWKWFDHEWIGHVFSPTFCQTKTLVKSHMVATMTKKMSLMQNWRFCCCCRWSSNSCCNCSASCPIIDGSACSHGMIEMKESKPEMLETTKGRVVNSSLSMLTVLGLFNSIVMLLRWADPWQFGQWMTQLTTKRKKMRPLWKWLTMWLIVTVWKSDFGLVSAMSAD